jgi:hypothetical protein
MFMAKKKENILRLKEWTDKKLLVDLWIDYCLTPTLAISQLYCGINKLYYYFSL